MVGGNYCSYIFRNVLKSLEKTTLGEAWTSGRNDNESPVAVEGFGAEYPAKILIWIMTIDVK